MPARPQHPAQLQRCVLAVAERLRREEGLGADEATSRAFALCTSSLQKHGYLKKGTHEPTRKGRARSFVKGHDEAHLLKSLRYQRLLQEGRRARAASRLDRDRFARHRAAAQAGGLRGAANRQGPSRDLCAALAPLREAMELVFSCDTAYGTCKSYNPAAAHCFMASALLQDLYGGGQIVSGEVDGIPHYWFHLSGRYIDLTGDQFGRSPIQCSTKSPYPVKDRFHRDPGERDDDDVEVQKKYDLFKNRVSTTLRGMGQRGMASALEG